MRLAYRTCARVEIRSKRTETGRTFANPDGTLKGLYALGFKACERKVSRLLKAAGYRLQAVFKTKEGAQHPDRDAA